jgi:hypothetical protein
MNGLNLAMTALTADGCSMNAITTTNNSSTAHRHASAWVIDPTLRVEPGNG